MKMLFPETYFLFTIVANCDYSLMEIYVNWEFSAIYLFIWLVGDTSFLFLYIHSFCLLDEVPVRTHYLNQIICFSPLPTHPQKKCGRLPLRI